MKKLIFFAFCLLSIVKVTTTIDISCSYRRFNFYILRKIYTCVIGSVSSPDNPAVFVNGAHTNGNSNDNVQGLHGNIGSVEKFPRDISNSFKNLIAIYFTNGQIKELVADDLKSFRDLEELYFDRNKIEVVEEGTFDFNPKLAGISFMSNRLIHIHANVFDHLTNLKYLWLNGNPCSSGAVTNNRNSVLNLIATATSTCQSAVYLRLKSQTCQSLPPPKIFRGCNPQKPGNKGKKC